VADNAKPATASEGLKFVEYEDEYAIFEVGSGNYSFESKYQK